jgi:hypothetical protein
MKLAALALIIYAAADMSAEEREEFAAMKAQFAAMKAESAAMKDLLMPAGALFTFADGRTTCPVGYAEPAHLKGRMMTTLPINSTSGAVFNRPFGAGEIGRTPAHSHAVSVNDPGHTHVGIVNDPGHAHNNPELVLYYPINSGGKTRYPSNNVHSELRDSTTTNKTGISVENLPAKSSIEVSIDANDAGEHYPLVYVLLCQKLP